MTYDHLINILLKLTSMHKSSRKEIADFSLQEAINITQSEIAFFGFLNEDASIMHTHAWSQSVMDVCAVEDPYLNFPIKNAGIWAEPIRMRSSINVDDYNNSNPLKKGLPEGHVKLQRLLSVPVFDAEKIVAIITVGNKKESYNDIDIKSLQVIMQATWSLIQRSEFELALRKEKERFRIVADTTVDWEIWQAPDGSFNYVSPSCEQISEYTAAEFYENSNLFEEIILPEDKFKWENHRHEIKKKIDTSSKINSLDTLEIRIKTKSGKIRWIEHQGNMVLNENGEYLGIRVSNRDITLRKLAEFESKQLRGLLPICSSCKKIRNNEGHWETLEIYIHDHSKAEFTHSMCPDCGKEYFPEFNDSE